MEHTAVVASFQRWCGAVEVKFTSLIDTNCMCLVTIWLVGNKKHGKQHVMMDYIHLRKRTKFVK